MNLIYDKISTAPKMKNCADYTMICIHYLVWGIVLEISKENNKKKNAKQKKRNSELKPTNGIRQ